MTDSEIRKGNISGVLTSKARKSKIPLAGTFELSPICNMQCRMCYVRKTSVEVAAHSRTMMSLTEWKKIADEAFDKGMLFLLLTGGEPFLWPDFKELYQYLAAKGFIISINTNGTLIDEETLSWLSKQPPNRINITLYGSSDDTYEKLCGVRGMYHKTVENIDRLIGAGINVKLNCSLTPYNAADLADIVSFAKKRNLLLSVGHYMFPPVRREPSKIGTEEERFSPSDAAKYLLETHRLQDDHETYSAFLKRAAEGSIAPPGMDESCIDPVDGKIRCGAGRSSTWITWDGLMIPCGMFSGPHADLRETSFANAWELLTQITEKIQLSGICQSCKNQFLCHSCAAIAAAETGDPCRIPRYLCEMADEIRRQASARLSNI